MTLLLDPLLHWIVKTVKNFADNVFLLKFNQLFEFQSWPKVFEIQNLNCIWGNWAQSIFQSLAIGAVVEGRFFALVGKTHPLLTSRLLIHSWARLATVHIAPMQCTFQRTFIWYFDSDILPKELVFFLASNSVMVVLVLTHHYTPCRNHFFCRFKPTPVLKPIIWPFWAGMGKGGLLTPKSWTGIGEKVFSSNMFED